MSLHAQRAKAQSRLTELIDEIGAVGTAAEEEGRDLNESDNKVMQLLQTESESLTDSIQILNSAILSADKAKAARMPAPASDPETGLTASLPANNLPARVKYTKSKVFDSTADAYNCGRWLQAVIGRDPGSMRYCRETGFIRNDNDGDTDGAGAFAVPTPLAATMIRLVEEYGIFRRYARPAIMTSNTLDVPKIATHTTVYYPATQGAAITTSDLGLGQVNLVAKKYASQTLLSTELQEDAVVSMVDQIATDFAWNFAKAEDFNSFLGEVLTAPNIIGIQEALLAGSNVDASGGISLATLEGMLAKLPQYPGLRPRWFMHSWTYHSIVVPALVALGGTDMRQTEAGGDLMLYGYPVTFTQVLPGAAQTTDDMPVVIGDLGMGAYSGTRRNFNVRQLNELYAATDQIGILATMRADSVIHDVGTSTVAGCIVKATITA